MEIRSLLCLLAAHLGAGFRPQNMPERSAASLLAAVDTDEPDQILYPPQRRQVLAPANTEIAGAKHTNKFWGNWVVSDGNEDMSIYPSPYSIRFKPEGDSPSGGLNVMKGETDYQGTFFTTHWRPNFVIGAVQAFSGMHKIVREQHFGVHAQVRPAEGSSCKITYPVYAGMAYVSAKYEGTCTPKVTSDYGLDAVEKVGPGIWLFRNGYMPKKEFRVYLLTDSGEFVDDSYDFNNQTGELNKNHAGWIRLADIQRESDRLVLDQYVQTILTGWDFEVEEGVLKYNFETVGPEDKKLLHWAYANHIAFLTSGAELLDGLYRTRSPVKGKMIPLVSDGQWVMSVDITKAHQMGFLPENEPEASHVDVLKEEVDRDWLDLKQNWRMSMHKRDHYFSGKGFQKVATVCHMLAKFKGKDHADVKACAGVLKDGFSCMYKRTVSDGSDRKLEDENGDYLQKEACWWSPFGAWYDEDWGGIPSRWDDAPTCGLDFGNSCYNDHHYHYGYFVVAGAMLVDLDPAMKEDTAFVKFINMFIRDVANPSPDDPYFPQFRSFDFFDMHSWSRGLKPEGSGKDQESTSEEVNFHYGMLMWAKMIGNEKMAKLAATTLTLTSRALQEYFIMRNDNPNHPRSFSKYHVTGIFFQNKVHLTTWFGQDDRFIHGIQMLPLGPQVLLSRTPSFAWEEWVDRLHHIPINHEDKWWSILLTGNLAMHAPVQAWGNLTKMKPENYDDGLTKSWALYWTSTQKSPECVPQTWSFCPGNMACPLCGKSTCTCPEPGPPPPPPAPPPPGAIMCNPDLNQMCPGGIPCPVCGDVTCACP